MHDIASCHPFDVICQFRPMQQIPGCEAGHSPLSIVEFKNKWTSTSNLHYLLAVHKEIILLFTCYQSLFSLVFLEKLFIR